MAIIVEIEKKDLDNKKPEDYSSGKLNGSCFKESNGPNIVYVGNSTIFDPLITHNGKNMDQGFFKVPRSLYSNSLFNSLTIKAQNLFIRLLSLVCYKPQKFDAHGNFIDLQPGQYGTTFRELAKLMGKGYDKDVIKRALDALQARQLTRQETLSNKTIITITYSEYYVKENNLSATTTATTTATTLRQDCDTKEESKKEKKEKNNKDIAQSTSSLRSNEIFFCFDSNKFINISENDMKDWKTLYPAVDLTFQLLKMKDWCLSNLVRAKSKKKWRSFITNWLRRNNEEMINKEAYKKQNNKPDLQEGKFGSNKPEGWKPPF